MAGTIIYAVVQEKPATFNDSSFPGALGSNSLVTTGLHPCSLLCLSQAHVAFLKMVFDGGGGLGDFYFDIGLSVQENTKEKKARAEK